MSVRAWRRTLLVACAALVWLTGCRADERAVLRMTQAAGAAWHRGDMAAFDSLVDHVALMNQLFAHHGEDSIANQHNVWPRMLTRDTGTATEATRAARQSRDPYVVLLTRLHPMYRADSSEALRLAVLRIANDSATVGVIGRLPGIEAIDTLAFRLVRRPPGWRVVGFANLDGLAQRIGAHRKVAAPRALDH